MDSWTLPSPNNPTTQHRHPMYSTTLVWQKMAEASFEPLVPPSRCARGRDGGSEFRPSPASSCVPRSMASMAMAVYAGPTDVGSVSFQVCLHGAYTKHIYVHCPHGNVGRIHRSTVVLLTCLFTTYRAGWLGVRCLGNLMVTMFCRCNPNLYVASRAHTKKGDDVVGW